MNVDDEDDASIPDGPQLHHLRRERGTRQNGRGGTRALGGFIDGSGNIKSGAHASALLGLLHLAANSPGGIVYTLGYSRRTSWFNDNISTFFRADGPLGAFTPIQAQQVRRHFKTAENAAKAHYDRSHSSDQNGSSHEDVPDWAQGFFPYFEALSNQESSTQQEARRRQQFRQTVSSIAGRQAPLGHDGLTVAELRSETSPNDGTAEQRQQVIGQVGVQRISLPGERIHHSDVDPIADADPTIPEALEDADGGGTHRRQRVASAGNSSDGGGPSRRQRVEGDDDVSNVRTAPRGRIQNGVQRRNVALGFDVVNNDPSARFSCVQRGYEALNGLTNAFTQYFDGMNQGPPRRMIDVLRDYEETTRFLQSAPNNSAREIYSTALEAYASEINTFQNRDGAGGGAREATEGDD